MANDDVFIPGQRLKLMALESIKSKIQLTLIGYKKKKYLVTERPATGTVPLGLTDGTLWMANFVQKGEIFTFQTQVIGASTRPVPLIFLSYPQEIDRTSLRQDYRIPVNLPTLIKFGQSAGPENSADHKGLIRDISEGGCQLLTATPFQVDTILQLTLVVQNQTRVKDITAEVKSSQDLGGRYLLGLSFSPSRTSAVFQELTDFIQTLRATPIRY